jgi:hypothetical protein
VSGLVIAGVLPTVITSVALALLQEVAPLLAVIVTLVVPAVVGVPEITPVLVLTLTPGGSGVALKLVGLLVAEIVYEKATPTVAHTVSGLVITGVLVIVNVCVLDVAWQLTTVIEAVPAAAIREAGTVAVSCVEETTVVASAVPFHFTVEPETKFVPFTVKVNPAPPGVAQVGLSELMVGVATIVNVTAFDAEPVEFLTVT